MRLVNNFHVIKYWLGLPSNHSPLRWFDSRIKVSQRKMTTWLFLWNSNFIKLIKKKK